MDASIAVTNARTSILLHPPFLQPAVPFLLHI
jgi:hypothetical protein